VSRVAKRYLNPDQSTTGWFVPLAEAPEPGAKSARVHRAEGAPKFPARGPSFYREPESDSSLEPVESLRSRAEPLAGAFVRGSLREQREAADGVPSGDSTQIAPKVHRRNLAGLDVITLRT